jgi:aromatic-L-amino-acid decarboxylase
MQFPTGTRGLFTSGGSMSNFSAVVTAREQRLGTAIREGTLYTSTQAHQCVIKAAKLAGVLPDRVRTIGVDEDFRLRLDLLEDAIARDRRQGLRPFLVVSSGGTTNTGAVDPLDAVADLCAREGLWHHVDGAYGGFFHACPELRPLLWGLSRADSLTLDPHKGLFLPYGTGCLLVRDGRALRQAHTLGEHASYLPDLPDLEEFYDPSQHGPDLSRGFPGLRVWLTVKLYGAARLRAAIAEKRELALDAARRLAAVPGIAMDAPPQLSLFAFHLEWSGSTQEDRNRATTALLEQVTCRGRVMITGCTVEGRVLARVCVLSFRTHQSRIDDCVADVTEAAARLVPRASA